MAGQVNAGQLSGHRRGGGERDRWIDIDRQTDGQTATDRQPDSQTARQTDSKRQRERAKTLVGVAMEAMLLLMVFEYTHRLGERVMQSMVSLSSDTMSSEDEQALSSSGS